MVRLVQLVVFVLDRTGAWVRDLGRRMNFVTLTVPWSAVWCLLLSVSAIWSTSDEIV